MQVSQEVIDALKAKYPDAELHLLSCDGWEVVAQSPSRVAYRMFRKAATDPNTRDKAIELLVEQCVVAVGGCPSVEKEAVLTAWSKVLDKRPALTETFGGKLLVAAGVSEEANSKKL